MTPPRLAAVLGCTLVALASMGAAAAAEPLPVEYNGLTGYAHASPSASPPGSNNWSCRPSRRHPRPVVLVHGTFVDMFARVLDERLAPFDGRTFRGAPMATIVAGRIAYRR